MKDLEKKLYPSQVERRKLLRLKAKRIATWGENFAADLLIQKKYRILSRNFRAGRQGEIDIIALDPCGVVTFVEVKTRRIELPEYGIPEIGFEAVGYRKQQRILLTSSAYMAKSGIAGSRWRYDVIVVILCGDVDPVLAKVSHVESAFYA